MFFNFSYRLLSLIASLLVILTMAGCAAELHHRDGMQAMDRREYASAVLELEKAAELKPQDVAYRKDWLRARETATTKLLNAATTALAAGKEGEAEQSYRTILKYEHDNARALAGLELIARSTRANEEAGQAREALKRGDLTMAAQLVERALKNAPGQAEARAVKREIESIQAKEMLSAPSLGAMYKKPINLEFRDASIKMIFDALSRTTGINFIFDREVKGDQRTTVFLKQTTLDDAIDVILSTSQLDKKILNASSVLIYPNTSAKNKEYQDLIVKAFYMANVEAKQTANMLKTVLKIKDVFVDDKYNMLILRENPETIALAEKLIALHDLDEPEVMLEVEVLEVNRSSLINLGVQVSSQLSIAPLSNLAINSGSGATGTSSQIMKLSDFNHLNSDLLGITLPSATINMKKTDGDANLLANPRIRVRDREKAKILIGDKVPVVTTTSSGTFVTENITYLDVGLKLEVEPDIHLRDEIGLKIALEVSSLVSSIKTNNGSQAYQIGTRNFSSALRLKDGETQVLAGLISDEDRSAANRIPLLGDLPLLGRLFSSQSDNRQKTEIVLSITPHLIRNIQRNNPAAESFWSGTETSLRNKPLQLRNFDANAAAAANTAKPKPSPAANPATGPNAPKMLWNGPGKGKRGEVITLDLNLESIEELRASSLQVAFNPAEVAIVSVKEGDFFSKNGKANFSQVVDAAGGRISVGASSTDGAGIKGSGKLMTISYRPIGTSAETELSVIGVTPIGSTQAIGRPGLPIVHNLIIEP